MAARVAAVGVAAPLTGGGGGGGVGVAASGSGARYFCDTSALRRADSFCFSVSLNADADADDGERRTEAAAASTGVAAAAAAVAAAHDETRLMDSDLPIFGGVATPAPPESEALRTYSGSSGVAAVVGVVVAGGEVGGGTLISKGARSSSGVGGVATPL